MMNVKRKQASDSGATLMEAVISIGVLAVALPLVYGAMGEAGRSGMNAEAETRSAWIVPVCFQEVKASREGRSAYFPETADGEEFPAAGGLWALAFTAEGKLAGKVTSAEYDAGVTTVDGEGVRYVVTMSAEEEASEDADDEPMLRLEFVMEYPAGVPAKKRRSLEFQTRIP
ncbi:MAG: hypothetical protein ACQCXQ_15430 [Verrucomicrobiales bacterium]|nr:hypothetical protein [Verrucomicrobiota bacterium JB025]